MRSAVKPLSVFADFSQTVLSGFFCSYFLRHFYHFKERSKDLGSGITAYKFKETFTTDHKCSICVRLCLLDGMILSSVTDTLDIMSMRDYHSVFAKVLAFFPWSIVHREVYALFNFYTFFPRQQCCISWHLLELSFKATCPPPPE